MVPFSPGFAPIASTSDDGTLWQIQAGITKNWTGLGNTAFYGEYARGEDLQRSLSPRTRQPAGLDPLSSCRTTMTMWGLGVVQNIDAAAMESIWLSATIASIATH